MGLDTIVTLGDFAFNRYEVPEEIPFGGDQHLVVHQLVGGARIVDAMGRDDDELAWRGMFIGEDALERARFLDTLRAAGNALALSWSEFNYTVVIRRFHCSFQRFYKLPYEISCLVIQDNTNPVNTVPPASFDDMIIGDAALASTMVDGIGDSTLSSLMATLNTAIAGVSSFASAFQSTLNSVLQPLAAVQARVGILIASTNNTLQNVTTVGGILPGNSVSTGAAKLTQQVSNMQQLPQLRGLQGVLGRMSGNLSLVNSGPNAQTESVAGGNLFSLAQQKYGDATRWTAIAQANGTADPVISGVKKLVIPPKTASSSGGVLST